MKRALFLSLLLTVALLLTACSSPQAYTPTGEFYVKTSPSRGDAGVMEVISLEADKNSYENDGDIVVEMSVGFGHLPNETNNPYSNSASDTFYVNYSIIEISATADKTTLWEKKVEYGDSWYDTKYNTTKAQNNSFLFIPCYGDFYPLYKENVEIVFPAGATKGNLLVEIFSVMDEDRIYQLVSLECDFERTNGVLTLKK